MRRTKSRCKGKPRSPMSSLYTLRLPIQQSNVLRAADLPTIEPLARPVPWYCCCERRLPRQIVVVAVVVQQTKNGTVVLEPFRQQQNSLTLKCRNTVADPAFRTAKRRRHRTNRTRAATDVPTTYAFVQRPVAGTCCDSPQSRVESVRIWPAAGVRCWFATTAAIQSSVGLQDARYSN